ncbi:lanthionine synthetase [Streptococcus suis]|nr:lanthionine synthetase [Streptococcus suis]
MDNLEKIINKIQRSYKEKGAWIYFNSDREIPQQGWKIHVSSQLKDSVDIFNICQEVLFDKDCYFKVAKDMETLKKINSPRETSSTANKFITIYTKDNSQARELILELNSLLYNFDSPKILSDFQCGKHSSVHYRFGAFKEIKSYNKETREVIYMLQNEKGELVEDVRNSYFFMPEWQNDLFSEDEKKKYFNLFEDIPNQSVINNYIFEKILKKSNRGNVYQAIDKKTKEKVIIKQVRPFITDDMEGKWYAIDELKNESKMLKYFTNKKYTANFLDEFEINGDNFLVQSYIEGLNYYDFVQQDVPMKIKEQIVDKIVAIINNIHSEGYKLVDISPSNFIYRIDGSVHLIDLENITHSSNEIRRVKTPFMVNPDNDLSHSSFYQDYFSLAMLAFSILSGQVMSFSKRDEVYELDCVAKVIQTINYAERNAIITKKHSSWLVHIIHCSVEENSRQIGCVPILSTYKENSSSMNIWDPNIVDYEGEAQKIIDYLLKKVIADNGRIERSSIFGEFVNPVSFQHGISGYVKFISKVNKISDLSAVKTWIRYIESIRRKNKYTYENSLLFGQAGYAWSLIDLYLETGDEDYKLICKRLIQEIMISFLESEEIDFALGSAGILLTLIKYSSIFKDKIVKQFVEDNINRLADFIEQFDINERFDVLSYSFAHGVSGIAYTLDCYIKNFNDGTYQSLVEKVNNNVVRLLEEFSSGKKVAYSNLELSWCEGISGLILYLCLVNPQKYISIINKAQDRVINNSLAMGTSYCHGVSSLIQTFGYVDRNADDINGLLISKSYRKEDLLVFQSENRHEDYFDFGVGTLGIYWVLLGYPFPFEV